MPNRPSPPLHRAYSAHMQPPTDRARPIVEPRDQREPRELRVSEEQRADWTRWLTKMLLLAGYAVQRPDRRFLYWWKSLSNALADAGVDVPPHTLTNYVRKGSQPSFEIAAGLARVLGLHPLSVLYRSGLYSLHDLAILLGSGQLRTAQQLYEELEVVRQFPASSIARQNMEKRIVRDIRLVQGLQQFLSEEEFGGLQAELVKLEIAEEQTPYTVPEMPATLPPPTGYTPPSAPTSVRPGPSRRRVPQPGDEPEE